jgi:hypothetical protein
MKALLLVGQYLQHRLRRFLRFMLSIGIALLRRRSKVAE